MNILIFLFFIVLLFSNNYAFSQSVFHAYVINKTNKKLNINGSLIVDGKRQKLLNKVCFLKNNIEQKAVQLRGRVYIDGRKEVSCEYDFTSYLSLDSYGKNYKTFLVIDEKKNKIRCRGLALEFCSRNNAASSKAQHLFIKQALQKHVNYKKNTETRYTVM